MQKRDAFTDSEIEEIRLEARRLVQEARRQELADLITRAEELGILNQNLCEGRQIVPMLTHVRMVIRMLAKTQDQAEFHRQIDVVSRVYGFDVDETLLIWALGERDGPIPRYLYHFTSACNWPSIAQRGIIPWQKIERGVLNDIYQYTLDQGYSEVKYYYDREANRAYMTEIPFNTGIRIPRMDKTFCRLKVDTSRVQGIIRHWRDYGVYTTYGSVPPESIVSVKKIGENLWNPYEFQHSRYHG